MREETNGVDDAQAARLARKISLSLRTRSPIWKVRGEHREEQWKAALVKLPADVQGKIRHRRRIEGDPAWLELAHRIRAAGPSDLPPLAPAWTALTRAQAARAREHLGPALATAADAAARRAPPAQETAQETAPAHQVPPPRARRDAAAEARSLEIALHSPRTQIWQVRWDTPEPRWRETLALLPAGERQEIRQREAEEDTPKWLRLARHVLALLPAAAEDVATPYVVNEWRNLKPERVQDARESIGDVLAGAIEAVIQRDEERRRVESEEEAMHAKKAYADAARAAVITGPARLHHAAVSGLPIAQLRAGGLAEKDVAKVKTIRSEAMLVGAAAAYVGVPRGRLDRWEKEGRIACSYHKSMQVYGAGWVEARLWTTQDAKKIRRKVRRLDEEDRNARAAKRRIAARRPRAKPASTNTEPDTPRVKPRRVQPVDQAPRELATEAERLDDMVLRTWRARIGFAPAVLADAERAAGERPEDGRIDLRHLALVTIDPDTARDHDDAVFCERTAAGWILHVAIADVAAFVRAGSRLDAAIAPRGQSLYLPTTCVPMCPPALSERACSLVAGEDRLALWTELAVSHDGAVTSAPAHTMRPALVRVRDRLTYRSAERALQEGGAHAEMLATLDECANALGARRRANGCIVLEWSDEVDIAIDPGGKIGRPTRKRRLRSEQLVEEAMIAHNVRAAEWLAHTVEAPGAILPHPRRAGVRRARARRRDGALGRRAVHADRRPARDAHRDACRAPGHAKAALGRARRADRDAQGALLPHPRRALRARRAAVRAHDEPHPALRRPREPALRPRRARRQAGRSAAAQRAPDRRPRPGRAARREDRARVDQAHRRARYAPEPAATLDPRHRHRRAAVRASSSRPTRPRAHRRCATSARSTATGTSTAAAGSSASRRG